MRWKAYEMSEARRNSGVRYGGYELRHGKDGEHRVEVHLRSCE